MTFGSKNSIPEVGVVSVSPVVVAVVDGASVGNFGILHMSVSQHSVVQVKLVMAAPPSA